MLSDRDIFNALNTGHLRIDPLNADDVQPASVDVHLGDTIIDPETRQRHHIGETPWEMWPGTFWLATTLETVSLSASIAAVIDGKSSYGRLGVSVHQTAGYIDPGFSGQVTLELTLAGTRSLPLTPGQYIGQLRMFWLTSPAMRPYGSKGLGSHYQGQVGPTPSWMTEAGR